MSSSKVDTSTRSSSFIFEFALVCKHRLKRWQGIYPVQMVANDGITGSTNDPLSVCKRCDKNSTRVSRKITLPCKWLSCEYAGSLMVDTHTGCAYNIVLKVVLLPKFLFYIKAPPSEYQS